MKKDKYSKLLRGGDNTPTNKELWNKALAAAKQKFDKYPSAYANAWASKYYKERGGDWKKMADGGEVTLSPEDMNLIKRRSRDFGALETALPTPRSPEEEGGMFKGAGAAAKEAYKRSDRGRAPEFFKEGYQLESRVEPTTEGGTTFEFDNNSGIDFSSIMGQAEGGMVGSLAALTTAVQGEEQSSFPEPTEIGMPMDNQPSVKIKSPPALFHGGILGGNKEESGGSGISIGDIAGLAMKVAPLFLGEGGYVVTRSNERKGKTHKVTAPDGTVKFFGDPNLKNRPNNPQAKASWYARHAKSLKKNPHFRAYARATWAEGGIVPDEVEYFEDGGQPQGVQSPVTRELLADSRPTGGASDTAAFPNRTGGDEDELPLPPDFEETPEEKKKREDAARAAAAPQPAPAAAVPPAQPVPVPVPVPTETPKATVQVPVGTTTTVATAPQGATADDYRRFPELLQQGYQLEGKAQEGVESVDARNRYAFKDIDPVTGRVTDQGLRRRDLMVGQKRDGMSPLAAMREGIKESEDKDYAAAKAKALQELGGYEDLLEDTPENAKKNDRIIQINSQRRDAAMRIASEVIQRRRDREAGMAAAKTAGEKPKPAPAAPAEEPKPAAPPAPTGALEKAVTAAGTEATAAQKALEAEGAPAVPQLAPPAPFVVLKDDTGKEYTAAQLNEPAVRYSSAVKDTLKKTGDYQLVYEAAVSVGYKPTQAEQIAIDEVLRNKSVAGLGPVPTGMGAMDMARSSPEYEKLRAAIAQQALTKLQDAKLAERQASIERQIKDAEIDLEIKRIQDFEIKKGAIDAQVAELRRQILTEQVDPDRFLAGKGVRKGFAIALGLLGKGLGAKTSIVDYIDQRVKEDINLQVQQLGRKQSLVGMLVQQGNELEDALKLADAYYKNMFAALLEKSTAGVRDERAKLAALGAASDLQAKGAKQLEEVVKGQVDAIYEPYKLKLQSAGTGVKSAAELLRIKAPIKAAGIRAAAKKTVTPPAGASPELTALYGGQSLDQGQFAKVNLENKDLRLGEKVLKVLDVKKKQIKKKDGSIVEVEELVPDTTRILMAYDKGDRDKAQDATTKGSAFVGKLNRLDELLAKYNYQSSTLLADAKDKGAIEVIMGELANDLGILRNIGVPQEAEYQRIVASLPNMEMFTRGELTQSKLNEFRKGMIKGVMDARNSYLVGGGVAGTGAAAVPPPVMKAPPVRTAKP